MNSIRRDVSKIVGMVIPPNGWKDSFRTLEREGALSTKVVIQILVLLLKRESKRDEEQNIEVLDQPKVSVNVQTPPNPVKTKKTGKNVKK